MRVIIVGLALTLAVLLNFIGLTSQSKIPMGPPPPVTVHPSLPPRRVELPPPFYYNLNGEIRAKGHPNVLPVVTSDILSGASDGRNFFPIILNSHMYIINLRTHEYIEVTPSQMQKIRQRAENFMRANQSSSPPATSSNLGDQ